MTHFIALPHRTVITLKGEGARDFLQGLISNDMRKVSATQAIYAALLTPQGKFLHDFFITEINDTFLLDTDASRAGELLRRLAMYKLRLPITIAQIEDYGVWALIGETNEAAAPIDSVLFTDPRHVGMGKRLIAPKASGASWLKAQTFAEADNKFYEMHRLNLGIPEGDDDLIPDKSFLLESGFEELHGVDFAKGCYVGQEVTARTKYRGQIRKSLYKVESAAALPPSRTVIKAGELEIGEMRSSHGTLGLALVRTEELEKALLENKPIVAGDTTLTLTRPDWLAAQA